LRAANFDLEERLELDVEALEQFLPRPRTGVRALSVDELGEMSTIQLEFHGPSVLAPAAPRQHRR